MVGWQVRAVYLVRMIDSFCCGDGWRVRWSQEMPNTVDRKIDMNRRTSGAAAVSER